MLLLGKTQKKHLVDPPPMASDLAQPALKTKSLHIGITQFNYLTNTELTTLRNYFSESTTNFLPNISLWSSERKNVASTQSYILRICKHVIHTQQTYSYTTSNNDTHNIAIPCEGCDIRV